MMRFAAAGSTVSRGDADSTLIHAMHMDLFSLNTPLFSWTMINVVASYVSLYI
jgi:hypothetical protein